MFKMFSSQPKSANTAKERLRVLIMHDRKVDNRNDAEIMKKMQIEILEVVRKYYNISQEEIQMNIDNNNDKSVLELNISLPDHQ